MKTVPTLTTDAEAEAFLEQDLSSLDFSQFKPVSWETAPKAARINMRLPEALMAALKAKTKIKTRRSSAPDACGIGNRPSLSFLWSPGR